MRLSLEVLRARKGDCLMLHYGTTRRPGLMIIDGGPSRVFGPELQRRVRGVRAARSLAEGKPLPVDVLMVSHVDDDHIRGLLELSRLLREQQQAQEPLLVRVRSLWHNSFDDLVDTTPEELEANARFGEASLSEHDSLPARGEIDAARVLASIPQGRSLRLDAKALRWRRNREFGGKLILASPGADPVAIGGLELTIVGPLREDLQRLQAAHDKWLKAQERKLEKDPEAALAAFTDRSIPNLSSLVVLVSAGGKSVLLTGDARGDRILKGLALTGLLASGPKSTLHVDVLKVPHHGSANNVTKRFFERVTADHYVLSGNGEHGNPERQTLEMILAARRSAPFDLHFTYPIEQIDAERAKDWKKQQGRERRRREKDESRGAERLTRVRDDWSATRHGLRVLLDESLGPNQKIHVVSKRKPHVIDLLETSGA